MINNHIYDERLPTDRRYREHSSLINSPPIAPCSAASLVSDNRLGSSLRYCINTGGRFTGKLVLTELQVSHCWGWHGSTDLPISTGLRAQEGAGVEETGGRK